LLLCCFELVRIEEVIIKILVAVDFGLYGRAQVNFLKKLGAGANADIRVVHVMEPLRWELQTAYPAAMQLSDAIIKECRENAVKLVSEIEHELRQDCAPSSVDVLIKEGSIANELMIAADEFDADLVIVGSHGKSGIARFLLGSVSQAIAINSTRSILIARLNDNDGDQIAASEKEIRSIL